MLQDIFPHRFFNQFVPDAKPESTDIVLPVFNNLIAVKSSDPLTFFTAEDFEASTLRYLFKVDDTAYFQYIFQNGETPQSKGFTTISAMDFRSLACLPKERLLAVFTAKHLADWYRDTAFCGRCGSPMDDGATERSRVCRKCSYTAYPRIMPAVIVGVLNGDRLLVTRYATGYSHNALVAGFTEIGETLEQTVEREVMEEAGIKVKNIRYFASQPWGPANDILAGYFCEVDGDDTIHMDENELKSAQWLTAQELELQPDDTSLTNAMMKHFKYRYQAGGDK